MKSKNTILFGLSILLSLVGFVLTYLSFRAESAPSIAEKISSNVAHELTHLENEANMILAHLKERKRSSLITTSNFTFLLYTNNKLTAWSDNHYVPSLSLPDDSTGIRFIRDGTGEFLIKQWKTTDEKILVGIIPLHRNYKIVNEYLKPEWNAAIFPSASISLLEANATIGVPIYLHGICYFRISFLSDEWPVHPEMRLAAVLLFVSALLVLVVAVYQVAITRGSSDVGFLFLFMVLLLIRFGMLHFDFPGTFVSTKIFNPQFFASSRFNASLGDLIINLMAILLLCYYLFRYYHHSSVSRWMMKSTWSSWLLSVFSGLCIFFAILFPFITIQTIYNNSSIELDITQSLNFDFIRVMSIVAVIISGICSFLFTHVFVRILIGNKKEFRILICFFLSMGAFVVINELTGQYYRTALVVGVFYFLTVYGLKLFAHLKRFSYATFGYLFVAVFSIALVSTTAITVFSQREKLENQFRFANNFLIDRDYFGEYLLRESSVKISNDLFIQSRIASPFLGKDVIRQKIRQVFLPSYFNKYDIVISLFDASGTPIDNAALNTFSDVISFYDTDAYRTVYPGVYFINNPQADVTQKYLVVVPIKRFDAVTGHIIIELLLKKIIPESVYPELLVDNRFQQFYRTQDLSYAVFSDEEIQFTSGDYNYELFFDQQWLGDPNLYRHGIQKFGFDHIAQEDHTGRVAIVSTPSAVALYTFANFSFLFVLGLAILLGVILIQGVFNYWMGTNLFFSARIQLILNLAFFLPLIVVSITTLGLTSNSSRQQLRSEYQSKAKAFGQQLTTAINVSLAEPNGTVITSQLTELAKLSNLDASLYRPDGFLEASTQPLIVESGLLSGYINPVAFSKISDGESLFIEQERIGKLDYFVAYTSLKHPQTGVMMGMLGIPFYQSGYLLEKVQITILANILNVFAGIFIVLLVLSYFVSKWLIFPLTYITRSLNRTSLTGINEPITWNANDELGLLAKEYNQMLYKLSESKAELEQTQRERAWREIAQQVAHEVKNPLTPMKLTLQQLERAVKQGTNTNEKTEKALSSLLVQVDTLNEIASSFSSFAKMPEPVMQRLELVSLLKRIIDLHSQSGDLNFATSSKELFILGDEQLLGRTFSNLIINALQAARPGSPLRVDVAIEKRESSYLITVKDNGKGIAPAIAERIFLPHFSTKKSGSGLGLAIARQAIEQMHGKIWFETAPQKGTTFFIELRLT
ncbi:MAG: HAMP domain-containing histidine kinase [Cyclobacteriaceae bacterium]|nr:HAMP domain-containing histidine kinase [Cyclobacteriaceae bacterium]